MAKGDDRRVRNTIARESVNAGSRLDKLTSEMIVPTTQKMFNNYDTAANNAFSDYGNIMGEYDNFSKTGGYSPLEISSIRSRALSPLRSIYASANRDVDRQRTLQGGYMPGYGTLKARMARDMGQGMSDAAGDAEANIAQMINSGKRFGTAGKQSLFGTSPGMASTFGNQLLSSTGNWLQAQGLQNQLSLGIMGAQNQSAQLPGNWDHTMNRIGQVGQIGGLLMGIPWGGATGAGAGSVASRYGTAGGGFV